MSRILQREQGSQVLKLFSWNEPVPDCVMFDFFKGGERAADPIGLEQKFFGLRGRDESSRGHHYERFHASLLDNDPPAKLAFESFMQGVAHALDSSQPLWIEISRPKGSLSLVPWERFLAPYVDVPVLRWPYHLLNPEPSRSEGNGGIDIVLCASVPQAKSPFPAHALIQKYVEGILGDAEDHRFHLFVDFDVPGDRSEEDNWSEGGVSTFNILQEALAAPIEEGRVILYDPQDARSYGAAQRTRRIETDDRITSPWLQWMIDSLRTPKVDLVHFLCHGYLSRGRGSLAFAESPIINRDRGWARFVGGPELVNFLDQIGAWSVGFTSPFRNFSEAGIWALADEVAEARPGPVLVHDLHEDEGAALLKMFCFLYRRDPGALPLTDALSLYAHPALLTPRTAEADAPPEYVEVLEKYGVAEATADFLTKAKSSKVSELRMRTAMPSAPEDMGDQQDLRWVAASQRILEQKVSEVAGQEALLRELEERGEAASKMRTSSLEGRKRALSFVADLLNSKLKSTLGE